jgi:hypothetical protein
LDDLKTRAFKSTNSEPELFQPKASACFLNPGYTPGHLKARALMVVAEKARTFVERQKNFQIRHPALPCAFSSQKQALAQVFRLK